MTPIRSSRQREFLAIIHKRMRKGLPFPRNADLASECNLPGGRVTTILMEMAGAGIVRIKGYLTGGRQRYEWELTEQFQPAQEAAE